MAEQTHGPSMICATGVMRTGPTRIGRVGGFTLPRTVSVVALAGSAVGAMLGMALASMLGSDLTAYVYGAAFGGAGGWFVVSYSPLRGESLLKWFQLQASTATRARYIDGERVTLAVGVALLPRPPVGRVRLLRSAVRVPVGQYDERGVPISAANRNLPSDGGLDPAFYAALTLPGDTGELTAGGGIALTGRRAPNRSPSRSAPAPSRPSTPSPSSAPSAGPVPSTDAAPAVAAVAAPRHLKD